MWKTFTSTRTGARTSTGARSAAWLITAWLLGGCAMTGGDPVSGPAPGDVAAADHRGRTLPPAPEVSARNADVFARGTAALQAGRLVEAEALLLQVTDDQPELAGPWVNLARVFVAQGREDHAIAALEQAVLANPGNCAARTDLGVLLRRRGEFESAEAHYLACLEYQPDYQAAHLNLGILYDLYLGRLNDALAAYRRYQALAAEPDGRVGIWVVDLERRLGS